jgi:hypothetical protein
VDRKLILAILVCAAVAAPLSAPQIEPSLVTTSQGIVTAIGSEADARQVVTLLLDNKFEPYKSLRHYVLASQVREQWLPDRTTIQIGRLAEADVQRHLATCGHYWVLFDITRKDNVVSMKIGLRCGCTVSDYVATFENKEWHLRREGDGCGCGGSPPGCPCFGR